jgi:hypothetical protein
MFRLAASAVTFAPCGVGLYGVRSGQELEPSYLETSSLSWSWLTFRVLTTDLPALPPQTQLPRQRSKYEQSAPPMNVWRSFDVYQQAAATSTGLFNNPTVQRPRPWVSASRPWPSTRCSATSLPTIFQARTSLDFEVYEAFPSQVATHNSSLRAFLRAVRLETPR